MDPMIAVLAEELGQKSEYVENVVRLLDEGNTIPFIARYRKELHGAMDDTVLRTLETRLQYLRSLQERRETVLSAIAEQGKLTEELAAAIASVRPWPNSKISTAPTSPSGAPALPSQRKRDWSPWPRSCSPRSATAPTR